MGGDGFLDRDLRDLSLRQRISHASRGCLLEDQILAVHQPLRPLVKSFRRLLHDDPSVLYRLALLPRGETTPRRAEAGSAARAMTLAPRLRALHGGDQYPPEHSSLSHTPGVGEHAEDKIAP